MLLGQELKFKNKLCNLKLGTFFSALLTIMYRGNDTFEVVESINSKLAKGDTFTCPQFVEDQPLYLSNLSHPGIPLCNYVAGQNGGIKWNLGG